ncbi:hypothetical protein D3C76_1872910 [compost metagenome]
MYTRNGSVMLIRSSIFCSSSKRINSRLRVMVWPSSHAQTNSLAGMMASSATSMPIESSLKRTM